LKLLIYKKLDQDLKKHGAGVKLRSIMVQTEAGRRLGSIPLPRFTPVKERISHTMDVVLN
jgi:hypothetical protein